MKCKYGKLRHPVEGRVCKMRKPKRSAKMLKMDAEYRKMVKRFRRELKEYDKKWDKEYNKPAEIARRKLK